MQISTSELRRELTKWQTKLEDHLPDRVDDVLDEIKDDLPQTEEIGLFDFIIRVIFAANKEPTQHITELLIPINTKNIYDLEEWTIQKSATFIRDYLKKDSVIHSLENKEDFKEPSEGLKEISDK